MYSVQRVRHVAYYSTFSGLRHSLPEVRMRPLENRFLADSDGHWQTHKGRCSPPKSATVHEITAESGKLLQVCLTLEKSARVNYSSPQKSAKFAADCCGLWLSVANHGGGINKE